MATKPPVDPAIYARVFEELRDGQDILEELVRRFARPAKLEGGIDAVLATYPRAGARRVVAFLVNRINAARGFATEDPHNPTINPPTSKQRRVGKERVRTCRSRW